MANVIVDEDKLDTLLDAIEALVETADDVSSAIMRLLPDMGIQVARHSEGDLARQARDTMAAMKKLRESIQETT